MTPKEKAKELVNNFLEKIPFADAKVYEYWKKEMKNKAIECALIAVDEILNQFYWVDSKGSNFWQEVKIEIENIK